MKELQGHRTTGNNYSTPSPVLLLLVTTEEEENNIVVGYQKKLREQHQKVNSSLRHCNIFQ